MSVHETDSQESSDCESLNTKKMYERVVHATESKVLNMPIVFHDSENYMLRGVNRPVQARCTAEVTYTSSDDRTSYTVESCVSSVEECSLPVDACAGGGTVPDNRDNCPPPDAVEPATAAAAKTGCSLFLMDDTDNVGNDRCARILSFHSLLCSCEKSCCCNCGTFCSTDCHACFHNFCARYFSKYPCQKNKDALPPATLDYDKVS